MFTRFKSNSYTMIPVVFVLMLFLLIASLSCAIIAAGGNVYSSISDDMDVNYGSRVSFSYIATKLRQNDKADQIASAKLGDDINVLVINETYEYEVLSTYLYYYDGYIREIYFEQGLGIEDYLMPEDGEPIIESSGFEFEIEENVIRMTLIDKNGNVTATQVSMRSRQG